MTKQTGLNSQADIEKTNIVLAFNNRLVREGITNLLNDEENMQVVAEASNLLDLIQLCEGADFDVLVLDTYLKGLNLKRVLRLLKNNGGKVILIIDDKYDEDKLIDAILSGVRGYLLQDTNSDQLKKAINAVSKGQPWIERKITGKALDAIIGNHNFKKGKGDSPIYNLTEAEIKIVKLVLNGYSNKKIATELYLSEKTIKFHLYKIFKKLSVRSRSELILYGYRNGIET